MTVIECNAILRLTGAAAIVGDENVAGSLTGYTNEYTRGCRAGCSWCLIKSDPWDTWKHVNKIRETGLIWWDQPILSLLYPVVSVGSGMYVPMQVRSLVNSKSDMFAGITCVGKARNFGPCGTKIGGFPKAIAASRAKEQNAIAVWINGQTLNKNINQLDKLRRCVRKYLSPNFNWCETKARWAK